MSKKGFVVMKKFTDIFPTSKIEEVLAASKLNELIHKKEDPIEKKKHSFVFVLAIIGAVAAIAAIAYCVYKCMTPDYLDDFEDDFDDDFDDAFEDVQVTDTVTDSE